MTHRSWLKFLSSLSISNVRREKNRVSREDDENSSTLRSKGVFNRHFDIIERDVSGASGRRVTGLNRLCLNTLNSRDQNDSETIIGLAARGEAVGGASNRMRRSFVAGTH